MLQRVGSHLRTRLPAIGLAALVAVFALASAPLVPAAQAGKKNKKPDLVPKDGAQQGTPYAFRGEAMNGSIQYEIKNQGKQSAKRSATVVNLWREGGDTPVGFHTAPKLKPGERARATIPLSVVNTLPAGAYTIEICVDITDVVKEEDERNNCADVKGSRFYSTYRGWQGSFNGGGPVPGLNVSEGPTETARSSDATLGFGRYLGGGVFEWDIDGGTATFTTQGADGYGCGWSGSATFVLERKRALQINYDAGSYLVFAQVIDGATYETTGQCNLGGFPFTFHSAGPVYNLIVDATTPQQLSGTSSVAGAGAVGKQNFTWNLTGQEASP